MRPLNAKDIEKLENTSVASSAMAATAGNTTEILECGVNSICVAMSCLVDSGCNLTCEMASCAFISDVGNLTGLESGATSAIVHLLRAAIK